MLEPLYVSYHYFYSILLCIGGYVMRPILTNIFQSLQRTLWAFSFQWTTTTTLSIKHMKAVCRKTNNYKWLLISCHRKTIRPAPGVGAPHSPPPHLASPRRLIISQHFLNNEYKNGINVWAGFLSFKKNFLFSFVKSFLYGKRRIPPYCLS